MREFRIAVFPGDGIGREVMAPCLALLDAVITRVDGFRLRFETHEAGAEQYRATGIALPEDALLAAERADAILLGAMGLPDVRYPDGTEVAPHLDFRQRFQLYAGRAADSRAARIADAPRGPAGAPHRLRARARIDRGAVRGADLTERDGDTAVRDTMLITRRTCERLFAFAFTLARARRRAGRPGRVTCVDKANVLPSMAFFRRIFLECAAKFPDVPADCAYVDAVGLRLVRSPWDFDVLVTENMFGDILSDVGAALMGGMGMAPSADIGDEHAVFQPCHGTAPDIAGRGLANPTAMFLSAAMMLEWLGERHTLPACSRAAATLVRAVEAAFADGTMVTAENGGTAGTATVTARVLRCSGRRGWACSGGPSEL